MKRLIALAAALVVLAVPAAASAHIDYKSITLTGSPWSSTFISGPSAHVLGCWEADAVAPGQTKYLVNGGSGGPSHWGIAVAISSDYSHWHGSAFDSDIVTGA